MRRIFIFIACLSCLLLVSTSVQALQLTLEQTVVAGLEANPNVESAQLTLEGSRLNVKAARGSFLPTLNLQTSYSMYSQSGDVPTVDYLDRDIFTNSLRISQPLFAGFAILSNYQKAKIQVEADAARLAQARLELIFAIQQDFLQLLKLREDLQTLADAEKRLKSQLNEAGAFYKAGLAPHNEVLNSEVELARARTNMIKVKNQIKNQIVRLNTYRAVPFDQTSEYVGVLQDYAAAISFDLKTALSIALKQRADLQLGRKSIAIAKKDARAKFAQYYPRVTLDYTIQHQKTDYDDYVYSSDTQDSNTIGVNLQWNLFDGGTTTYTYKSALKRIAALERSQADQVAQAEASIIKAFTDIEDAEKYIRVAKEAQKSAQENYDMAAARYSARLGTITDLSEAHYYLTRAVADVSNAYMQYQISRASLFYNIGIENPGLSKKVTSEKDPALQ